MSKYIPRVLLYTTEHMYHKVFMLSQKLGMVQGAPIPVTKVCADAVIDYFDLNNDEEWDGFREKLCQISVENLPIGKRLNKEKQNGK